MNKNEIEILIPTFNEEGNIEKVIIELNEEGYENITILDGNSKDKTVEIAKKNNCRIILDTPEISSFGGSIINGLKTLNSNYFCIFDGDNSFNPKDISFKVTLSLNFICSLLFFIISLLISLLSKSSTTSPAIFF